MSVDELERDERRDLRKFTEELRKLSKLGIIVKVDDAR